jgi:hypothetical protein
MGNVNTGGPHKTVLSTYGSHDAAQHAVDVLAQHKFPVEHVTIVGSGLKLEERVLGRWTLGKALLTGAVSGGWIGLMIGLIFWIITPWATGAVTTAILLGVVFGAIWAATAHVVQRHAFASAPAIVADHYDVLVDAEFAEEARRVLSADALSASAGSRAS